MHINSSAFKPSVNLRADYLNGLPLANLFTLKTNQTFEHIINVLGSVEVTHPLIVQGYVNGVFIEQERANTLMVSKNLWNFTYKNFIETFVAKRETPGCDSKNIFQ